MTIARLLVLTLLLVALAAIAVPGRDAAGSDRPGSRSFGQHGGGVVVPPYKTDSWSPDEAVATAPSPEGRYELHGDGVSTPYHWVWVPRAVPPAPAVGTTPYGPAEGRPGRGR